MDKKQLVVFTADVRSQMQLIHQVMEMLEARAQGLQPDDAVYSGVKNQAFKPF